MSQIWIGDENASVHMAPSSVRKGIFSGASGGYSSLKQSAKKSVLGKLDNVLHHKQNATPFRGAPMKMPMSCSSKKSTLSRDSTTKRKQKLNLKNAREMLYGELLTNTANKHNTNNINYFDEMDYPSETCLKKCQKPITELWSDSQGFNDDFFEKLINGVDLEEKENFVIPRDLDIDEYNFQTFTQNNENVAKDDDFINFEDKLELPNFDNIIPDICF